MQDKTQIGLINPKSPYNVHAVMRAAGNFRVNSVHYTGKRYPDAIKRNPNLPDMSRKVSQTIPLTQVETILDAATDNIKIVCIEFAENASPLTEFVHPDNAMYIFGPEDNTISQDIINKADAVVYIPTVGCMNLSATVNVVLYDRFSKLANRNEYENNDVILKSRDINNLLIVNN